MHHLVDNYQKNPGEPGTAVVVVGVEQNIMRMQCMARG